MTAHQRRIVALLEAWLDYEPAPKTSTGQLAASSQSRPAAERRPVVCDRCGGYGRVGAWSGQAPDPRLHELCDACQGAGVVSAPTGGTLRPWREDDWEQLERHALSRLQVRRERRKGHPGFVLLASAMQDLAFEARSSWWAIVAVHVLQWERRETLPVALQTALDDGLEFLAERIVDPLPLPAEVRAALLLREHQSKLPARWSPLERQRANRQIRELHATGEWSQAALARKFGVSRRLVQKILSGNAVGG